MKKCFCFIFLLGMLCLSNCQRRVAYPPVLQRVDSLTYVNPQIALQMLDSIRDEMTKAEEPILRYYQLLTVKAQDKGYITHTSDSLMLTLVDYYEHKGDKSLLPEAYYYLGSTYRDMKDAPRALEYYQNALTVMGEEGDLKIKSPVYAQMGDLFHRQYLYDNALAAYRNAYLCDSIAKDTVGLIYDLRDIATIYRRKNEIDRALFYFQKANAIANTRNDKELSNLLTSQIASLQIRLGQLEDAKKTIQPSLEPVDTTNISSIYSIVSDIYFKQRQYDSAAYYYNELLTYGDIYAQRRAHERLADIANTSHRYDDAHQHLLQYEWLNDSIERITATESVAQMKSLYDYQLREKENMQLQQQKERIRNRFIVTALICTILFILLGASVFIYRRRQHLLTLQMSVMKHNAEEQYKKTSAYIEHNKQEIIKLTTQIDQLQQEISTEKEEHFNEKQRLLEELERQRQKIEQQNKLAEIEMQERSDAGEKVLESDVFKELRTAIDSKKLMTEKMLEQVENLLNKLYPDFLTTIQSCNLSKTNYVICLLTKMGIQSIDIATLIGRERSTITKAKPKIYKKITGLDGKAIDFDNYIQLV